MSDQPFLLPFEPGDSQSAADLHGLAFPDPWSVGSFDDLLKTPVVGGLKVLERDALAGFILYRVVAGEAEILTLAVNPGLRRQGVGAQLLGGAMVQAIAGGAEEMFLEVASGNIAAIGLYHAFGFEDVAKRSGYYGATGDDARVMRCRLSQPSL